MKKVMISLGIIMMLFLAWWARYLFFVPHFKAESNHTLVSKDIKLILVSDLPEQNSSIHVPHFIPFWKTIGIVDGEMSGTLWEFTDHETKYVSYYPNTEMAVGSIYQYSKKVEQVRK